MNASIAAAVLRVCALFVIGVAIATAQTVHVVPLDRSEVIQRHEYSHIPQAMFSTQANDAIQIISFGTWWGPPPGEVNTIETRRGFLEFTIPNVSGVLTATLVLEKYYDAGVQLPNVPFEVSVYDPQGLITTQHYDLPTAPVTTFSTNYTVNTETVAVDVTAAVTQYRGRPMGLRIKVADEGSLAALNQTMPTLQRGAAFADNYHADTYGTNPPRLEIVETTASQVLNDLIGSVSALVADPKMAASLGTSLAASLDVFNNDDPQDDHVGANMLKAFINKVEAQRGKKIPNAAADELVSAALILKNQVGM